MRDAFFRLRAAFARSARGGLAGALAVGTAAQSILFQMTGADPAVLVLSAVALALVALCAGFIPAHRASRSGPDEGVEITNSLQRSQVLPPIDLDPHVEMPSSQLS